MKFTCTHCDGAGFVGENKLRGLQRKVFMIVRGARSGIKAKDLAEEVYKDDESGGPYYPLLTIQAVIRKLNRRMQKAGARIVSNSRNDPYLRYRLVITGGEPHADVDHGDVHRGLSRRRHGGGGEHAVRKEE